ncbi:MAG: hypothetical protein JW774_10390 [Candidatus Aureabacteria bacterium]|nr:hypothetical protein [Candidatus Auribacterota bacterium]
MEDAEYSSSKVANSIAFVLICFFFYQLVFQNKETIFLDHLNLAYHEAGHLFLSCGSQTLHILGGTLGQLFFPLLIAVVFFMKGQKFASSVMGFWFFENFMNIARYVEDAEETRLPLVGGFGGPVIHDWNWLLSEWNCLDQCYVYADRLRFISKAGMSLTLIIAFVLLIASFRKKSGE